MANVRPSQLSDGIIFNLMRFSLIFVIFVTTLIAVATATMLACLDENCSFLTYDILRFIVTLMAASALTIGVLASERMRVFCLTWGIFVTAQNVCNSSPSFVRDLVEGAIVVPPELEGRVINYASHASMIAMIWFDVVVATMAGCLAVVISTYKQTSTDVKLKTLRR